MDDDFTFPTVVVAPAPAAEGVQQDLGELPFPGRQLAGGASSLLWPFSSSSPGTTPPPTRTTTVEEEAQASPRRRSEQVVVQQHAEADDDEEEDRMDLLWEGFNDVDDEDSRGRPAATEHRVGGRRCRSSSSTTTASDAESEETSTSGAPRHGCAPTMLRASSRAGGAGQFCNSRSRRTTTGWALLLRLFRRLFAVDKTPPPSRSRRHGRYPRTMKL